MSLERDEVALLWDLLGCYRGDIVVADRLGRWVRLSDTALVSSNNNNE